MNKKIFWFGFFTAIDVSIVLLIFKVTTPAKISLEEIVIEDLNGNKINSSDLLNGKPLVLNVWATWCGPCVEEFPIFENAKLKYADKINFVMVSDEEASKILKFKNKKNYTLNMLKSSFPMSKYGIISIPDTYFFDSKGKLIDCTLGSLQKIDIEKAIEKLLN